MTKLASALEGGLAGASTLSLLTNTLRKTDGNSDFGQSFNGKDLRKRFKKAGSKKTPKATGQYVQIAGDLLGNAAHLGLSGLHKKKNLLLRGAVLGTAAGLGAVLLKKDGNKMKDRQGFLATEEGEGQWLTKALEVSLYTIGGLVAAKLIQVSAKKQKGAKKRKKH